jgi:hypothetical protein
MRPKSNRLKFAEACRAQEIRCLVLERRAIENYLDLPIASIEFRKDDASDFGPFDLSDESWSWNKERNWRIARAMSRALSGQRGQEVSQGFLLGGCIWLG